MQANPSAQSQEKACRVLVADDEETLRGFLSDLLRGLGHQPETAADGREALERLKQESFDLLITDLVMPHMDGLELLRAAREMDPDLVAIVLTGRGTMETAIQAIRETAYDYVTKPFDLEEFTATIQRALEKARLIQANKQLVAELSQERESLKHRVREATADLAQKIADLKILNKRLSVLFDIARKAHGDLTLEESLQHIAAHLKDAIEFEYAFCLILNTYSGNVRLGFADGHESDVSRRIQTAILMIKDEVTEMLVAMKDPSETAAQVENLLRNRGFSETELGHTVLAPMTMMKDLYGLFCLSRDEGEPFTEAERQLMQIVAANAAAIYEENAVEYRTSQLRTIGELTSEIAHDLKHPLTNVKAGLQIANEVWYDTDKRDQCIHMIDSEIGNMDRLIHELMSFSRSQQMTLSYLDVKDLIHRTLQRANFSLENSGVQAEVVLHPGDLMILANEGELIEAFMNLIVNAIQAMPDGGGLTIETRYTHREQEEGKIPRGRYAEIDFRDTGVGIPENKIHRVFDRFYTSKEEGTGLGLAIVERIIKKNLGYVQVMSQVDVGTTFTVGLPLR